MNPGRNTANSRMIGADRWLRSSCVARPARRTQREAVAGKLSPISNVDRQQVRVGDGARASMRGPYVNAKIHSMRHSPPRRGSGAVPRLLRAVDDAVDWSFPMPTVNVDRNLLFGLLALQNGLIDQDQLITAFRAWTRDKGRPIAEYLVTRGDLDADQRSAVQGLVLLHEKKHGGSTEKSLAAIPAGRSTRKSLLALGDSEIEGTLAQVGSGLPTSEWDTDADRTSTYSVGTSDERRPAIPRVAAACTGRPGGQSSSRWTAS